MHKVYVGKYLIKETDNVFAEYLRKYYDKKTFDNLSWLELYFWEFAWSGGEGIFLTTEHRVSYDITIPFNNRKYVELMLTVPLEKRSIRKIGVNIDYGKLENTGDLTVIDVPLTLSAAYRPVELALGVDYIGIEEIKELAKEKELNLSIVILKWI